METNRYDETLKSLDKPVKQIIGNRYNEILTEIPKRIQ